MSTKKTNTSPDIIAHIKKKQLKLKEVARELKKHFVGLDHIIDKIIKDIETWYVMPELLSRPVIICLWGPTGVGKTDLVRRLTKLLKFSNRYCEIEMTNKGSTSSPAHSFNGSVSSILSSNPNLQSGSPSVILLDEIQNFRTKDDHGHEIMDYKFRDMWTLLSDGKLPFEADIDYIMQLLWDYEKSIKRAQAGIPKQTKDDQKPLASYKTVKELEDVIFTDDDDSNDEWNYYTLKHFKKALRLEEPLEEIALWDDFKKKAVLTARINDSKLLYEEEDYTKALIFVSGNLDEAYEFATAADEVDVNADIFHDLSLKINILDIKRSLAHRFKPEQIARFGNTHVIYPSLSQRTYEVIIERKVAEIVRRVQNNHGISVEVDSSVRQLIYDNGVYPTQGVRPVFSTISEILESLMPKFLLQALIQRESSLKISYRNNAIYADIQGHSIRYAYKGVLDNLKSERNKNLNRKILTAVHEAAHAVVYAILFKLSPPQIVSTPATHKIEGFICTHAICGAKTMMQDKICVWLAGAEGERLIFGEANRTWGGQCDLREATSDAARMVRQIGMDRVKSWISSDNDTELSNTDLEGTNPLIENIIQDSVVRTADILKEHLPLYIDVTEALINRNKLTPKEFKAICKEYGIKIGIKKQKDDIYLNYKKHYDRFKKDQKEKK